MKARCPKCKVERRVSGHRGSKVADSQCPTCQVPLEGVNAGIKHDQYQCPITDKLVIPGLSGRILTDPVEVEYLEPEQRIGWLDKTGWYENLRLADALILGPGAVIADQVDRRGPLDAGHCIRLRACPDATAEQWEVNQVIRFRKCKGCSVKVRADAATPATAWTPARDTYPGSGRRYGQMLAVNKGPHPAGSPACHECHPPTPIRTEVDVP